MFTCMFSVSEIMNRVLVFAAEKLLRFGLKLSIFGRKGWYTHGLRHVNLYFLFRNTLLSLISLVISILIKN